jgi:hypothetical protein
MTSTADSSLEYSLTFASPTDSNMSSSSHSINPARDMHYGTGQPRRSERILNKPKSIKVQDDVGFNNIFIDDTLCTVENLSIGEFLNNKDDIGELKKKLQICDTIHDFGGNDVLFGLLGKILCLPLPENNKLETSIRKILYKDITENKNATNIYEILDKLFEKQKNRNVVVEKSGKGGLTTLDREHCFDENILYTEIYSKANQYDNAAASERSDIPESCVKYNPDDSSEITITTTKEDGLLVIDTVKLFKEKNTSKYKITYKIDKQTKTINFEKAKDFKFGAPEIRNFLQFIEQDEISGPINDIFQLNYNEYKNSGKDKIKIYIKCLFDFKRLGDLQLIKVAEKYELPFVTRDRLAAIIENQSYGIPFITGDRLAAIIANQSYGIPSLFISSAKNSKPELYTKEKQCIIYEKAKNIVDYLLDNYTNAENYINEEKIQKYLEHLNDRIYHEILDKKTTGGNPQDLPEKMNEDRLYYALGLFKIIDEYVPRDKGTVGDNTVLLFQYMFLGYMYDLHDEDVIDYVASQRTPYNIQQSVSKDTHTDVYNNNYNGIGYTATSIPIPIMVGGKQKTTKFMKNVIKDFKKLFV